MCLAVQYHARLCEYLNTFDKAFIVGADNVGSKQFQDIRAVSGDLLCQTQRLELARSAVGAQEAAATTAGGLRSTAAEASAGA